MGTGSRYRKLLENSVQFRSESLHQKKSIELKALEAFLKVKDTLDSKTSKVC